MILITGASGFLGQHLVRYLALQQLPIRALYHSHKPNDALLALKGVEWVQCDMLDVFAIEEVMVDIMEVYHCAAIVSFASKDRQKMLHFNTESTANIVNQALLQGIRKMVYVSSVAAIGRTGNEQKEITEEEEWGESEHNSAYGISKYIAEMEVWRGIGEGLNAVIVNPGIILGEGDWATGSAQLIQLAANQFPFYTAGINAWVDVADVVEIMYHLMQANITGQRYILSAGNIAYRTIFTMMAKEMNKKPPRYKATKLMTGLAWRLNGLTTMLTGTKTLITKETANTSTGVSLYNNTKISNALPAFRYQQMEHTISKMVKAFLSTHVSKK